ncbi:DUF2336 domain-containing protein [Yunchengibacter salinarum]|uniref:DUF2336 domain-containing protein n=1 Tax=Yunchengibacter salinarum TaxID=3133399 RepID=UPI0035B5A39F
MSLINETTMEKIVLAKRVGQFLNGSQDPGERDQVADVARKLAGDVCREVREVLAYELRNCKDLPKDLGARIAADVENVSAPFLEVTEIFTDAEMAELVPELYTGAQITVARRLSLGDLTMVALAEKGSEESVLYMVRNDHIQLSDVACSKVITRFVHDKRVLDQLGARMDLPLAVVEKLVDRVSDHFRAALVRHYAVDVSAAEKLADRGRFDTMLDHVRSATPDQIHAYVKTLREEGKLTNLLTLEMARNGVHSFLESALALASGMPRGAVRDALSLKNVHDFVDLMKKARVTKTMAAHYMTVARNEYAAKQDAANAVRQIDAATTARVA